MSRPLRRGRAERRSALIGGASRLRPRRRSCSAASAASSAMRAAMHDAAVIHHRDVVAERSRATRKFCSTSRMVASRRFSSRKAAIMLR